MEEVCRSVLHFSANFVFVSACRKVSLLGKHQNEQLTFSLAKSRLNSRGWTKTEEFASRLRCYCSKVQCNQARKLLKLKDCLYNSYKCVFKLCALALKLHFEILVSFSNLI